MATVIALDALGWTDRRRGLAVALGLLTAVPILANRKIAKSFPEDHVFAPTAFARFVQRNDPEGAYRTLDETLFHPESKLAVTQYEGAISDIEYTRRNWSDQTAVLFGRGTVFNKDFDAGDLSRIESLRKISGQASGFRDSDAFFGTVALKWGIRFRDQEPLAGYGPVHGDALQVWDAHGRAYPDIRVLEGWVEAPSPLAALESIGTLGPGEVVIESGAARRGKARPGTVRVGHRSPERLEMDVDSPDGGFLFVLRAFWPYRTVLLDGKPVEALAAQLAFCAVPIPPGAHHIRWNEEVPGWTMSRYGPVLFGLIVVGAVAADRRKEETLRRALRALLLFAPLAIAACRKESLTPPEGPDVRRPAEEWLQQEPIRLLRDYVRIDTTNDGPGEIEGAAFLKSFFDCAGIENETVCPAPRRCNLLARLPGKKRQGALLLLNHIDVVEAYAHAWKEAPPFEGLIQNGFLYGRGVYDMKSIAIAEALAMRRLKERGIVPESDVLFLAEADEEVGQRWGSRWLLDHRPEWFAGVTNVLNEGGSTEMLLRSVRYWGIETIQAGYALAELDASDAKGLEALQARYPTADGPIVEPHPHVVLGFNLLADHLASPLTDPMRHLDRVRKNPAELAILPDRYAAFLQARMHWIGPYPYPPAKPAGFREYAVVSVPPGLDPRPYLAPILDALPAGVRTVRTAYGGPAGASPYPTPLTEVLKRVTEAYTPGTPFGPMPTFGGYTTSLLFRERGFPAYGYSPIAMNITDSARRHGNDERVFLRDYLNGCAMYADSLEEYVTLKPAEVSVPSPAK